MKAFAALYRRLDSGTSTRAKQAAMVEFFAAAKAEPTQSASAAWTVYFLSGGKPRQTAPSRLLWRLAVETARRDPPPVYRGDLLTDVPALARQAPPGVTLVIFHSAVLAYVDPARREELGGIVRSLGATWISNEAPGVIPNVTGGAVTAGAERSHGFVLVRDGVDPVALTDSHGAWLHWLPAAA